LPIGANFIFAGELKGTRTPLVRVRVPGSGGRAIAMGEEDSPNSHNKKVPNFGFFYFDKINIMWYILNTN
jgi:hypothetical protein